MAKHDHIHDPESMTDEELMLGACRGSRNAFALIVRKHQRGLANFFYSMGVHNDAEDLTQDTFIKLFKSRGRYRPSAKFTTFLYFVARRIYVDYVRKQARHKRKIDALAEETTCAQITEDVSHGEGAEVIEALQELPEKMRTVVVLNVYEGLRYQEIADVLGVPLGTVKSRMFSALRRLREVMVHARTKAI